MGAVAQVDRVEVGLQYLVLGVLLFEATASTSSLIFLDGFLVGVR